MSEPEPRIDFTQIDFPADRLTVKQLRTAFPHSFDLPDPVPPPRFLRNLYGRKSTDCTLGGLIDGERQIASLAFKKALGLPLTEEENWPRWQAGDLLVGAYLQAGLAGGEHEAKQLIRHIEAQAAAQARTFQGRSR